MGLFKSKPIGVLLKLVLLHDIYVITWKSKDKRVMFIEQ
jgi:hypothetical protein